MRVNARCIGVERLDGQCRCSGYGSRGNAGCTGHYAVFEMEIAGVAQQSV